MHCARCGFTNLEGGNLPGAAFCAQCGTALGASADARSRRPGATRLSGAGGRKKPARASRAHASQPAAARQRRKPAQRQDTREGERRHLTVMFCDLVESTAISARLDPEDLRRVLAFYQTACAEMIERFEGHLARYLGDGILVYFGYPRAHEDDASRAVHAALDVITAIDGLNVRLEREYGVRLAVRIGIHTGLVVAGELV